MVLAGRDVGGYVRLLVVIYDRVDRCGAAAAPGRARAASPAVVDLRPPTGVGGRWCTAKRSSSASSAATQNDVRSAVRADDTAHSSLGTRGTTNFRADEFDKSIKGET